MGKLMVISGGGFIQPHTFTLAFRFLVLQTTFAYSLSPLAWLVEWVERVLGRHQGDITPLVGMDPTVFRFDKPCLVPTPTLDLRDWRGAHDKPPLRFSRGASLHIVRACVPGTFRGSVY